MNPPVDPYRSPKKQIDKYFMAIFVGFYFFYLFIGVLLRSIKYVYSLQSRKYLDNIIWWYDRVPWYLPFGWTSILWETYNTVNWIPKRFEKGPGPRISQPAMPGLSAYSGAFDALWLAASPWAMLIHKIHFRTSNISTTNHETPNKGGSITQTLIIINHHSSSLLIINHHQSY